MKNIDKFLCEDCGQSDKALLNLYSVLPERSYEGCLIEVNIQNDELNVSLYNLEQELSHIRFTDILKVHNHVLQKINTNPLDYTYTCNFCRTNDVFPDNTYDCTGCLAPVPYPNRICEACEAYKDHQK